MSFESEYLLVRLRARGSRLLLPTFFLALAVFLVSYLNGRFPEQWQQITVYVVCGLIAFIGFLIPLIRYLTSWTDITSARLVSRSGLFGQHFREVSLANVIGVELAGVSRLTVSVRDEEDLVISGVPKLRLISSEITRLADANK